MRRIEKILQTCLPPIPPIALDLIEAWYFVVAIVSQVRIFQSNLHELEQLEPFPLIGGIAEPHPWTLDDSIMEICFWSVLLTGPLVLIRSLAQRRWDVLASPLLMCFFLFVVPICQMAFNYDPGTVYLTNTIAQVPQIFLNGVLLFKWLRNLFSARRKKFNISTET